VGGIVLLPKAVLLVLVNGRTHDGAHTHDNDANRPRADSALVERKILPHLRAAKDGGGSRRSVATTTKVGTYTPAHTYVMSVVAVVAVAAAAKVGKKGKRKHAFRAVSARTDDGDSALGESAGNRSRTYRRTAVFEMERAAVTCAGTFRTRARANMTVKGAGTVGECGMWALALGSVSSVSLGVDCGPPKKGCQKSSFCFFSKLNA
jgi:hypothetical protein